jgi:hypothetical protein
MVSGWVEAFIVIAALAIVIQTAIIGSLFLETRNSLRRALEIVDDLHGKIDPILGRINAILEDSQDRIRSITADAAEMTRLARGQAQKVDRVFTDAVERLRIQVVRADHILTGALEVIEETGSKFKKTVWGPVHQASALLKGLKVGLDYIRGDRRGSSERDTSTEDEELFI